MFTLICLLCLISRNNAWMSCDFLFQLPSLLLKDLFPLWCLLFCLFGIFWPSLSMNWYPLAVLIWMTVTSFLWLTTASLVQWLRHPPRQQILGSNPTWDRFFGSSNTSDFKIGTPVATLPGTWCYRVSTGIGRSGVSILWLGEIESLICNFYPSMAACKIVWADLSLRYTSMLLGC